jgi:AcrR family transcriptional regulator
MTLDAPSASSTTSRTTDPQQQVALRSRIADAAIDAVRQHGTLRPDSAMVADAAGVTAAVVQEQFPTWDSLMTVAITRWHEGRIGPLRAVAATSGAVAFLQKVVEANAQDPHLTRLLISSLTVGSDDSHPASTFLRHQYDSFYRAIREVLVLDIAAGREPATLDPGRGAEQLLALYEGLQLQAMLRPNVDVVSAFRRAMTDLHDGWSAAKESSSRTVETFSGVYEI